LLGKMPGDEWQKFANLRLLYTYLFTYPGKKLLFMGCEIAQPSEWNHDASLPLSLLETSQHKGVYQLIGDLNRIYRDQSALHYYEFEEQGFSWIDCQDVAQSVISYQRKHHNKIILVILNFTPVPRENYRLGVPTEGQYNEILNSDSSYYGGSNIGNSGILQSENKPWMEQPYSLTINLPPLSGLVLELAS